MLISSTSFSSLYSQRVAYHMVNVQKGSLCWIASSVQVLVLSRWVHKNHCFANLVNWRGRVEGLHNSKGFHYGRMDSVSWSYAAQWPSRRGPDIINIIIRDLLLRIQLTHSLWGQLRQQGLGGEIPNTETPGRDWTWVKRLGAGPQRHNWNGQVRFSNWPLLEAYGEGWRNFSWVACHLRVLFCPWVIWTSLSSERQMNLSKAGYRFLSVAKWDMEG